MFELFYHCRNCGDGSVSVEFHTTEKQAIKADEKQSEGFAESSVSSVKFKIEDNNLYYSNCVVQINGQWQESWKKVNKFKTN